MSEYIKVKTTKDDGKVCLWEQSDQHPDNEIFIKNDGQTYTVGLTSEVARRIKDGDLVEVGSKVSLLTIIHPLATRLKQTAMRLLRIRRNERRFHHGAFRHNDR